MNSKLLIKNNIGLVHFCARQYRHHNTNYDDLISAGTNGLLKASEKFDPSKGTKFSTYGYYCIRGEMTKLVQSEYKYEKILKKVSADTYNSILQVNHHESTDLNIEFDNLLFLLPPMQRYVLNMKYKKKYSYVHISELLGLPKHRVVKYHDTAIKNLQKYHLNSVLSLN